MLSLWWTRLLFLRSYVVHLAMQVAKFTQKGCRINKETDKEVNNVSRVHFRAKLAKVSSLLETKILEKARYCQVVIHNTGVNGIPPLYSLVSIANLCNFLYIKAVYRPLSYLLT